VPRDVYSQVIKFQSELDEDDLEDFMYDEDYEEDNKVDDFYDEYIWEGN
jgi:hypothetical protein